MTVQVMCDQAALHSNRSDEFVKGDSGDYEDEALGYFNLFLGAINEAYFEAARKLGIPATEEVVTPVDDRIDLTALSYPVARLKGVMNSDGTTDVVFRQINRDLIQVNTDDGVLIRYTYFPTRLTLLTQEPDFPEEVVPSELYIFLAAARVYQSENKAKSAEPWLQQYYEKLSKIRHVGSGTARRVPVRRFR